MVCFQQHDVLTVTSITGGMAGSSSTLQPLFYGADTATAAVLSSVMALTPPWGVAHERADVWARKSACLCVCVSSQVCVSTCLSQCCD